MTMDVQDLAMLVRDPGSVVTCILLPLSASMHMHQQVSPPGWPVLIVLHLPKQNIVSNLKSKLHLVGVCTLSKLHLSRQFMPIAVGHVLKVHVAMSGSSG